MKDNRVRIGEPTFYSGLDDLSTKSTADKVAWFRGRFEKIVGRPLREVRAIGAVNEAIWDLNLGVVTIICSAIEALGSFNSPGVNDQVAFETFVRQFMHPKYREASLGGGRTYAEFCTGRFRCGLAHGLSIEGHEVATRPEEYIVDDAGYVSIDLWGLFEDMERAFRGYLEKVEADGPTQDAFIRRFDELFVRPYQHV